MVITLGRFAVLLAGSPKKVNYFVGGIFLLPIYLKLMNVLSTMFSFNTSTTTTIYYGILWIFLLPSLPIVLNSLRGNRLFMLICFGFFLLYELLFFPSSKQFIFGGGFFEFVTFQSASLMLVAYFILIGFAVSDFEHLNKVLHWCARVGILGATVSYSLMLTQGHMMRYDDMGVAYSISVLFCILIACWEKNDWIFAVIGSISLILAGTRGPILCVIFTVLFRFIIFEKDFTKKLKGLMLCVVSASIINSGVGVHLLNQLNTYLAKYGVSGLRILDYLNSDMLMDGSGRDDFAAILIDAIREHPIMGYGIGGDRLILQNGSYAHNIILELFVSLGVIYGGIVLVWIGVESYKILKANNEMIQKVGIGLFCGCVIKLFLSSSFILSKEFFMFLGICMAATSSREWLYEGDYTKDAGDLEAKD